MPTEHNGVSDQTSVTVSSGGMTGKRRGSGTRRNVPDKPIRQRHHLFTEVRNTWLVVKLLVPTSGMSTLLPATSPSSSPSRPPQKAESTKGERIYQDYFGDYLRRRLFQGLFYVLRLFWKLFSIWQSFSEEIIFKIVCTTTGISVHPMTGEDFEFGRKTVSFVDRTYV